MSKRFAAHVDQTRKAAEKITGGQLLAVTNAGMVKPTASDTDVFAGVAAFDVEAGREVALATAGCFMVTAGEAISAGDRVKPGAGGKAMKADTGGIGFAWTKAAKDGALVEIQVR